MHQKREKLWWLFWLPNMLKYMVWPGIEFVWHEFVYVRYAIYFITGFLSAPAIRLAWNWACPGNPISAPKAMAAVFVALGLTIFLTKTRPGNEILSGASALLILAGCAAWLALAAIPALAILAVAPKPQGEDKSLATRFYFGPLEWADKQFFLNRRAGN